MLELLLNIQSVIPLAPSIAEEKQKRQRESSSDVQLRNFIADHLRPSLLLFGHPSCCCSCPVSISLSRALRTVCYKVKWDFTPPPRPKWSVSTSVWSRPTWNSVVTRVLCSLLFIKWLLLMHFVHSHSPAYVSRVIWPNNDRKFRNVLRIRI